MLKIAICDNTKFDSYKMMNTIRQIAGNMKISGICFYIFDSAEKLMNQLHIRFDAVFIEAQLRNGDGITMAEKIREKDEFVMIIFSSRTILANPNVFRVMPYRFLIKGINTSIEKDIREILSEMVKKSENFFCFRKNNTIYKINIENIICITSIKRGCQILYLRDRSLPNLSSVNCNKKLRDIIQLIQDERFVFAHNSYAVNLEHIQKVTKTEVFLSTNICLSVARSKEKELKLRITEFYKSKYIYLE